MNGTRVRFRSKTLDHYYLLTSGRWLRRRRRRRRQAVAVSVGSGSGRGRRSAAGLPRRRRWTRPPASSRRCRASAPGTARLCLSSRCPRYTPRTSHRVRRQMHGPGSLGKGAIDRSVTHRERSNTMGRAYRHPTSDRIVVAYGSPSRACVDLCVLTTQRRHHTPRWGTQPPSISVRSHSRGSAHYLEDLAPSRGISGSGSETADASRRVVKCCDSAFMSLTSVSNTLAKSVQSTAKSMQVQNGIVRFRHHVATLTLAISVAPRHPVQGKVLPRGDNHLQKL